MDAEPRTQSPCTAAPGYSILHPPPASPEFDATFRGKCPGSLPVRTWHDRAPPLTGKDPGQPCLPAVGTVSGNAWNGTDAEPRTEAPCTAAPGYSILHPPPASPEFDATFRGKCPGSLPVRTWHDLALTLTGKVAGQPSRPAVGTVSGNAWIRMDAEPRTQSPCGLTAKAGDPC